jgi:hypothetical protein
MEEHWMMVYKAPMEYYLAACNHVTTLSAFVLTGYAIQEWIYRDRVKSSERKGFEMLNDRVQMAETDIKYFAIAFVAFNLSLRVMMRRYPLRIYKNANK